MANAAKMVAPALAGDRGSTKTFLIRRLIWVGAILAATAFFIHTASRYFIFTEDSYRIFWANRYSVLIHVSGASIALFAGLPQFSTRLRERYRVIHRWTGRLYLIGVVIGVTSAWYMSFHSVFSWTVGVATFFLGVAWVVTTGMAFIAIRCRQFLAHREWMIRSYVVTFAFVFFRLLFGSPLFADVGTLSERVTALLWMSFVFPLLITEVVLQWRRVIGATSG